MRIDLKASNKAIKERLTTKASNEDIGNLNDTLLQKIRNLEISLCSKLADKTKTKRAFASIDLQLARLIDVLSVVRDGDEAMFSRKPLGGMSCAS